MSSQHSRPRRAMALLWVALLLAAPGLYLYAQVTPPPAVSEAAQCCSTGCCCGAMETEEPSPDRTMPAGCSCDMSQSDIPIPAPLDVTAPPAGADHSAVANFTPSTIDDTPVVVAHSEPPATEATVNSPPLYLTSCTFLI